jgi:transposase-like protein
MLDKMAQETKMASVLSAKHYHDEDAAFAYVEKAVWPNGPVCPHCGGVERISKMEGSATRKGLHKCYQCRKQFTVRQGTIFESSHVPLHIWLQAIFFVAGSKKGVSSNQLHRTLGVTLKTAWFMSMRIREAMRSGDLSPLGGEGGIVEVDETFIGPQERRRNEERWLRSQGSCAGACGSQHWPEPVVRDRQGQPRAHPANRGAEYQPRISHHDG